MANKSDPWELVASGQGRPFDLDQVDRAATLLLIGLRHEIRGLPSGRSHYIPGGDPAALRAALAALADDRGLYWCINPTIGSPKKGTHNHEVENRVWLLIDIDPDRPADICATDEEKAAALRTASLVDFWMAEHGCPVGVCVDSGNGIQLLYRIEMPNDAIVRQLIAGLLRSLNQQFSESGCKIDTSVHNAARIARMPGTWNTKGANTADRPHRVCRILHQPANLECITIDQLRAMVTPAKKATAETPAFDPWTKQSGTSRLERYLRRAFESELLAVSLAPEGDRNNQLNRSAFACGQLVPHGLHQFEAVAGLTQAAKRAGLPEREIASTISRAVQDGTQKPRVLPDNFRSEVDEGKPPAEERLVIGADEVPPEDVKWLWPGRVAVGFIGLFAGQTGQGKSFVTLDFIARISKGLPLPNSPGDGECRRSLIISEDPQGAVLVPRLMELGADMSRVKFMTWKAMARYSLSDTSMLDIAFAQAGNPSLLVIDPPTNFLRSKDEHKNTEVRQVLMNLVEWLQRHTAACVMITHLNKPGKGTDAISRIVGSIAWGTVCRMACSFYPDPNDPSRSLMASPKNNLGPLSETLAYRIVKTETLATIEWLGVVDTTAEQANSGEKRQKAPDRALRLLESMFRRKRTWTSEEMDEERKNNGVSVNAMVEARAPLKDSEVLVCYLVKGPIPGEKHYEWTAAPGWPGEQPGKQESGKAET